MVTYLLLILITCSQPAANLIPLNQTPQTAQTEITDANWESHPQIKEIRRTVSAIDSGLKNRNFKVSERKFESCADQFFTVKRIARDAKGLTRWYEEYGEGEDSSWDLKYYYDPKGKLRFVFGVARSANGTREQLRLYFDASAKRIWQSTKLLKGLGCPGCFSAYLDSDKPLAFDPEKAFTDDSGCKEIKVTISRK